jgi:hypothetical protein
MYAFIEVRSWHKLLERHVKTEKNSKEAIVSYITVLHMHKSGSEFNEIHPVVPNHHSHSNKLPLT